MRYSNELQSTFRIFFTVFPAHLHADMQHHRRALYKIMSVAHSELMRKAGKTQARTEALCLGNEEAGVWARDATPALLACIIAWSTELRKLLET
jgi:hypothetical protein